MRRGTKCIVTRECCAYELSEIRKGGKSVLYQVDYDYPALASQMGHSIRSHKCNHWSTDGTVDCETCGKTVTEFIQEAIDYIDKHLNEVFICDLFSYIE
jgi:hypothetical protein